MSIGFDKIFQFTIETLDKSLYYKITESGVESLGTVWRSPEKSKVVSDGLKCFNSVFMFKRICIYQQSSVIGGICCAQKGFAEPQERKRRNQYGCYGETVKYFFTRK